jgi:hypothetical protein
MSKVEELPDIKIPDGLEESLYKSFKVALSPREYTSILNCSASQNGYNNTGGSGGNQDPVISTNLRSSLLFGEEDVLNFDSYTTTKYAKRVYQ